MDHLSLKDEVDKLTTENMALRSLLEESTSIRLKVKVLTILSFLSSMTVLYCVGRDYRGGILSWFLFQRNTAMMRTFGKPFRLVSWWLSNYLLCSRLNKVKELEEALEVYYGKYKAQQLAKQTLKDVISHFDSCTVLSITIIQALSELETRTKDLTSENQKSRQAAFNVRPCSCYLPHYPECLLRLR